MVLAATAPGGAPWRTCPPAGSSSSPPTASSRSTSPGPLEVLHAAGRVVPRRLPDRGRRDRRDRARCAARAASRSCPTSRWPTSAATSTRCSSPGARARGPAAEDLAVVAAVRRAAGRSRRVALGLHRAPSCSPPPGCSTAAGRRPTGPRAGPWPSATPRVEVDPDPIFVRDGDVWTSAGVTAGLDLALALVEEDLGRRVALEVARWLVRLPPAPGRPVAVLRAARRPRPPSAGRCATCRPGWPSTSTRT